MRVALGIEYDGGGFAGWQAQAHASGIQTAVEAAVARVADHPVAVTAAGRTDAGVHALAQVVHFDTSAERTARAWVLGTNTELPDGISVLWARIVPDDFHARYSAEARSYRYVICNRAVRLAIGRGLLCWVREPLDAERMYQEARVLLGEHDFSAFRAAQCQARTPVRSVESLTVTRTHDLITLTITANAFLHHMVRNIAGSLIAIGAGKQAPGWLARVLAGRDRAQGGATAPPQGLYLAGVRYPAALALPSEPRPGDTTPWLGES